MQHPSLLYYYVVIRCSGLTAPGFPGFTIIASFLITPFQAGARTKREFNLALWSIFLAGGWAHFRGGLMANILMVGYIADLLQERERTLRAAGYSVTVASAFATASAAIQRERFDLAILTFSVPEDDRNRLARALKDACPNAKIIMTYYASVRNTELADALMQNIASAEDILRAVNHLLNDRNREQAG